MNLEPKIKYYGDSFDMTSTQYALEVRKKLNVDPKYDLKFRGKGGFFSNVGALVQKSISLHQIIIGFNLFFYD